jgi:hypothetical protein
MPDPMVYSEHVPVREAHSPVVHSPWENVDAFGGTAALDYHGGGEWSLRVPQRRSYLGINTLRRLAERALDQLGEWPPPAEKPTTAAGDLGVGMPPYPFGGPGRAILTAGLPGPVFSDPLTPEQNARTYLLAQVVQIVGPDSAADVYVELVRYLETGLRVYDDPTPGPPSVDEIERVREAVFAMFATDHATPEHAANLADRVVAAIYPGAAG